jgi:DNA helicase-2/ATP-dependent DNA helicase PcrA
MAIEINSDSQIDINQHFRVSAGPGAGKTHWLSLHVSHVLKDSKKLGKMGKVACLSYTNVGADTLMGRMDEDRSRVLSCTIHSFLYSYIVKPYLHFIAAEEGFNIELLTGEDDRILSDYKTFKEIINSVKQNYAELDATFAAIRAAKWRFQEDGSLKCSANPPKKCCKKGYVLNEKAYNVYKKLAWKKGYMHYDDVLYFSYKLIQKYPFICKTLSIQFPYVFVDEFQDTNPIQAKIINLLGENGAIVGVIGDHAQSIYGFLGADPMQFISFSLDGLQDYTIRDNRRSCNEIIDLLNVIRTDFQQRSIRNENGMRPLLLVGELMTCYDEAQRIANDEVHALSYRNIEANILKQRVNAHVQDSRILNQIMDSNSDRKEFVITWIKAIEHARNKLFGTAFKLLENVGIMDIDAYTSVKEALDDYGHYCNGTLMEFFDYLYAHWKISKIKQNSNIQRFYTLHTYRELSQCVGLLEDTSAQRTVHKAKGDEFDNVLVIFTEEKALNVLLNPDIRNEESDRVYYVAMSRARDRLFLTVPLLTPQMEKKLRNLPIDIRIYLPVNL